MSSSSSTLEGEWTHTNTNTIWDEPVWKQACLPPGRHENIIMSSSSTGQGTRTIWDEEAAWKQASLGTKVVFHLTSIFRSCSDPSPPPSCCINIPPNKVKQATDIFAAVNKVKSADLQAGIERPLSYYGRMIEEEAQKAWDAEKAAAAAQYANAVALAEADKSFWAFSLV